MEKKITTHFTKGLIIGLFMVMLGTTFQVLNIYEPWVQYISLGIYAVAIIWSCYAFSKDMNGEVNFGQLFSHGFKTAAIVTLISIAAFIITYLIMPEIKEKSLQIAREEMAKDPRMTEEIINQSIAWTDKFFLVFGIVGSLFGFALTGAISSLIGAAISKKTPKDSMPKSL
ncbi:MAG: DUF4199 domain-containing protein [Bacteroidota bacterium]|jgi:hypothetical protein